MSDEPANVTKFPVAEEAPAPTAAPEKREFDPTRAERIAINALNLEIGKIQAEGQALLREVGKRLGLADDDYLTFNPNTGKLEAVKTPAKQ